MSGLHRGAAIGWQLIASRLAVPAQHGALPSLSSTVLSGSSSWSVELAAQAGLAGWHRVTTLVSSLADARLLAVPKRKVTPHRKGKRSATKGIRFIPIVSQCSKCEKVFPPHSLPSKCEEDGCPAFNLRARPASSFNQQSDD